MDNAKRTRGRPKGSKNKNRLLSGATVAQICEYHRFNPTSFLVGVANGTDKTEEWSKDDKLRASIKLHDSIHHNKPLGGVSRDDEAIDGQYEIVFIEAPGDFQLPGTANAESITPTMREEPIQRAGDTPQGWQDSICDQQIDS